MNDIRPQFWFWFSRPYSLDVQFIWYNCEMCMIWKGSLWMMMMIKTCMSFRWSNNDQTKHNQNEEQKHYNMNVIGIYITLGTNSIANFNGLMVTSRSLSVICQSFGNGSQCCFLNWHASHMLLTPFPLKFKGKLGTPLDCICRNLFRLIWPICWCHNLMSNVFPCPFGKHCGFYICHWSL